MEFLNMNFNNSYAKIKLASKFWHVTSQSQYIYFMYEQVDLWSVFRVLNSKLEYDCNRWQAGLLYIWLYIWLGILLITWKKKVCFLKYILRPSA